MYTRVIPRDLFNEAKLLKCLGQLALIIHDGVDAAGYCVPRELTVEHDHAWKIDQRQSDGGLYVCGGLRFKVRQLVLELYTAYNSKSPYPLLCMMGGCVEIDVFNDDGTLAKDFTDWLDSQASPL